MYSRRIAAKRSPRLLRRRGLPPRTRSDGGRCTKPAAASRYRRTCWPSHDLKDSRINPGMERMMPDAKAVVLKHIAATNDHDDDAEPWAADAELVAPGGH